MNVTLTLGGLSTAASLAALTPGVSNNTAAQSMSAYGNTAESGVNTTDSLTTQSGSDSAFTRYTSQYRRLTSIVLDSGGKYDHDQQMRAYMELRTMAASGKLKGMQADDQRRWMEVNSSTVSLLQKDSSDSSDTSDTSSATDLSRNSTDLTATDTDSTSSSDQTSSTTSLIHTSISKDSSSQTSSSINDNDSGDTVDLSPTAQEIIKELQSKNADKLSPLEVLLSQQSDQNSSTEVGSMISLTV